MRGLDIGLSEKYWGQGIMTEEFTGTEYIFENTKLRRIYAEVFAKTLHLQKVLEKKPVIYFRSKNQKILIVKDGQMDDTLLYILFRTDFENR